MIGGLVTAIFLSHWFLPVSMPLQQTRMPGWITSGTGAHKGFFRHTFELPFQPKHAWVKIASSDYQLYVNGKEVARNQYVVTPTDPFLKNISDKTQRLFRDYVDMARSPSLLKRGHEGWRMVQVYDITPFLVTGTNVIGVAVQSDGINRFSLTGQIGNEAHLVTLPEQAQAWKITLTSSRLNKLEWFAPEVDDSGWERARSGGPADETLFTIKPEEVWTRPFSPPAISGARLSDGVYFRVKVPELPYISGTAGRSGWLRVASNWPYKIFANGRFLDGNDTTNVAVFDITRDLAVRPDYIYVWLQRPRNDADMHSPWLQAEGEVAGQHFLSGGEWQSLDSFSPSWLSGGGKWNHAIVQEALPQPLQIGLKYTGDYNLAWIVRLLVFALAMSIIWLALSVLAPRALDRGQPLVAVIPAHKKVFILLGPTLLGLFLIELLRFRFFETDTLLYYLDPALYGYWLAFGPAMLLVTWLLMSSGSVNILQTITDKIRAVPANFWILLIVLIGLYLRLHEIRFENLQADENVSWDAARGILHSGVPEAVSGVFYTRSPLYHYLLAGWLGLFGDNVFSARAFSVVPGVGVIIVFYHFMQTISRKRYLALLGALLIAIDPWELQSSRIIRFYQQMQFFSLLAVLYFVRGFLLQQGRKYQNYFFIACAAAVLSQEIFVTVFPGLFIAFLIYYKQFDSIRDRNILIGFVSVMAITLYDMAIFTIVCMTPHVGIATSSASIMQLHLFDVLSFINTICYGDNGANVLYTVTAIGGIFYWWKKENQAVNTLYLILILTVITLTVLVLQVASRYGNSIYPFVIALALLTVDNMGTGATRYLFAELPGDRWRLARRWGWLIGLLIVVSFFMNMEPWKIPASYNRTRTLEHQSAYAYIAQNMRTGDKVMSVYPMPAAILLGGIDYYLVGSVAFDELYMTPSGIVERWAGGKVVTNNDQLRKLFDQHERLWIVIDQLESKKMSQSMIDLIKNSSRAVMEFFGGTVYLWDKSEGLYQPLPDTGGNSDSY